MNNRKRKRLILRISILAMLLAAIVYTLYSSLTDDGNFIKVGDQAPNFVLTDLNGKTHRMSDYEGQGVFLNFWGTWCKPCEKEMPYIENQYNEYKDKSVQTIAVNVGESVYQVENFVNEYNMTFPVVIDKQKDVQNAYTIGPLPTTLLINPNGEIINIITGEMSEKDIKSYMEMIKPE